MANDAAAFVDADAFGEQVTYTPRGGTARVINAVVDRSPPARVDARGLMVAVKLTITVANNATTGISSAHLDAYGNDKITVAHRIGGPTADFGVYLPEGADEDFQDAAVITLDLR